MLPFLSTHSLLTLLGISLYLPNKTTLLNGSFSFLIPIGLCCIWNCIPSSWKWALSRGSSRIHLMKARSTTHTWDSFSTATDLNFWLRTLKARGTGRGPSQLKNKNFPQKRKRSMKRLGEEKKSYPETQTISKYSVSPWEFIFLGFHVTFQTNFSQGASESWQICHDS